MEKYLMTNLTIDEFREFINKCFWENLEKAKIKDENHVQESELLTIDDVVKLFKVSKVTIHKWKRIGLLPYHKLNRRLYFKKLEIINALKQINK